MLCPYCGANMIGHGHKLRLIKHPALRNHIGIIRYYANRYICKECRKTILERNPFAFNGFNSSFFLMQNALRLICNLNYNLTMISDELGISTTQLSKYIDSYITIPPRSLPECLGIDELHSHELSRRNSSYLCILVDNEIRTVWDVLDSRSKMVLSLFFSKIPREERTKQRQFLISRAQTKLYRNTSQSVTYVLTTKTYSLHTYHSTYFISPCSIVSIHLINVPFFKIILADTFRFSSFPAVSSKI